MAHEEKPLAYFRLEKNPVNNLKTDEDYERWSEDCFEEAEAFYNVAYRSKDMLFGNENIAVLTNISFACELYLKCLLLGKKIDCRKEYDLYKLYKMLPEETQEQIRELHPCGNTLKTNFEHELDNLRKAFTIFRYMYERGNMAWNEQFLLELLDTLHSHIRVDE